MTRETPDAAKFLVVKLEREDQATEVLRILDGLSIPSEVVADRVRVWQPGAIVVEIPADRLREAMVSLGLRGFADVRAYGREVVIDDNSRGPRSLWRAEPPRRPRRRS
jgi:hypothetical protein